MTTKLKHSITLAMLLIVASGFSQVKEAYISQNEVFKSIPNYERNLIAIDSLAKVYQKEVYDAQQLLEQRSAVLLKGYNPTKGETMQVIKQRMQPLDTLKINQINSEYKVLESRIKLYNDKITMEREQKLGPDDKRVSEVLQKYIEINKIKVVHNIDGNTNLLYLDKALVITDDIIKALKEEKK